MRFSDIYKRKDRVKEPEEFKNHDEQKMPLLQEPSPPFSKPAPVKTTKKKAVIVRVDTQVEEIYNRAIIAIKKQFTAIENKDLILDDEIIHVVGELLLMVKENKRKPLFMCEKSTPDVYLYGHSVNVCILSLALGGELDLRDNQLAVLVWGSLFHDIGLLFSLDIALMPRALKKSEYDQIKRHPQQGSDLWVGFSFPQMEIKEKTGQIILQHHERINGEGYPKGLERDEIDLLAKIVGLIDAYETMTHPRSWRDRFIPHEAMKRLVEEDGEEFDKTHIKGLIKMLSLYPLGSFIKLSTDEIARVVGVNETDPTRPVVETIINSQGERCDERRIVDLAENPAIYIKDAVDETKLNIADRELALTLRISKWWVKDSFSK